MEWFKKLGKSFKRSEKGQGMVEYALILALISVVAIGALGDVGDKITDAFDKVKTEVSDNLGGEQAPDEGGEEVIPGEGEDGGVVEEDAAVVPPGYELASDDDFEYIVDKNAPHIYENDVKGYYKYIGSKTKVAIPHKIKGNLLKDTFRMFHNNTVVTAVSNDNPNVVHTGEMFRELKGSNIDVSKLDTSNVVSMSGMFRYLQTTGKLDLSTLNTSKVTDMSSMFRESQITEAHIKSMDTSNVKDMQWMFAHSQMRNIDMDGWNTNSITTFDNMFSYSKASTINTRTFTNKGSHKTYKGMFTGVNADYLDLRRLMNPISPSYMRGIFSSMQTKTVYIFKGTFSQWDINNPTYVVGGNYGDSSTPSGVNFIERDWIQPLP